MNGNLQNAGKSNKYTQLVFVVDRSGSMDHLVSETISSFNSMLAKQKETPGDTLVTTVLFDDRYEVLHDALPLHDVRPITEKEYYVRGSTALLDAVGRTVESINRDVEKLSRLSPETAFKVMFVIITDGYENASENYSYSKVKSLITQQTEKGWEFVFLGANIDAAAEAEHIGIRRDRGVDYVADKRGNRAAWRAVSSMACCMRAAPAASRISDECFFGCMEEVRKDFKLRKEKQS